jgi:hypothetical protein
LQNAQLVCVLQAKLEFYHDECLKNSQLAICHNCTTENESITSFSDEESVHEVEGPGSVSETSSVSDPSVLEIRSDSEPDSLFMDMDSDDEIPYQSLDEESDSLEVYEEPEVADQREGGDTLMLDIVQERLLNSAWSSSENENEEDLTIEEFFQSPLIKSSVHTLPLPNFDLEPKVKVEQVTAKEEVKTEIKTEVKQEFKPEVKQEPAATKAPPVEIKTTTVNADGQVVAGTKNISWLTGTDTTLDAHLTSTSKKRKAPSKTSKAKPAKKAAVTSNTNTSTPMTPAATLAANQWLALAALNMSLQKQAASGAKPAPVNFNSVASAAAALVHPTNTDGQPCRDAGAH